MFAAQISTGLVEGSSLHMGMGSPELFDVRRVSAVGILPKHGCEFKLHRILLSRVIYGDARLTSNA